MTSRTSSAERSDGRGGRGRVGNRGRREIEPRDGRLWILGQAATAAAGKDPGDVVVWVGIGPGIGLGEAVSGEGSVVHR